MHEAPIRVGLDLSAAVVGVTGVGRYARMLWQRLRTRPDVYPSAFAFGRGPALKDGDTFRLALPLRIARPMWHLGWPRAETILGDIDVFHSVDLTPAPTKRPMVMSWHDPLRLLGPEYDAPRHLQARKARLAALSRAAVVIVNSESSARGLAEMTGYPRAQMIVASPGFDIPNQPAPSPVEGPFVLAAGMITPRKGLDVLARAMASLGPAMPPLVIAGPDGHRADLVKQQIRDLLPPPRSILLGDKYEAMVSLYRQATIVCHPSLEESFGMVCLEAMGAGAAIVAADIPAIREMADGCVSLVPAGDHEAMAEAIQALLKDEDERKRLCELGLERSRRYSWDEMAGQCVRAYRLASGHDISNDQTS